MAYSYIELWCFKVIKVDVCLYIIANNLGEDASAPHTPPKHSLQGMCIYIQGRIRGGSRISEGEGGANMNGWLAKKSDNWLIQIAIVCKVHSTCGQKYYQI